jgi:outer membrane protein
MKIKEIIFSVVVLILAALVIRNTLTKPKIAYVDTFIILENFEGLKEARKIYESKLQSWHLKIDSLSEAIQYDMDLVKNMGSEEAEKSETMIILQRIKYNRYIKKSYEDQANEFISGESEKLSSGLIEQIDDYIQKYGEDNGYDLILGNAETGTILYRNKKIDITEEILKGLNDKYLDNE